MFQGVDKLRGCVVYFNEINSLWQLRCIQIKVTWAGQHTFHLKLDIDNGVRGVRNKEVLGFFGAFVFVSSVFQRGSHYDKKTHADPVL